MEDHRDVRRFVIIPKVAHPWFEEVRRGALAQAQLLQEKLGCEIFVDYVPPAKASVTLQNSLLAEVTATNPSGILIDPVDVIENMPALAATRDSGIPVVVFDSPSPDPAFTSVGNDFSEQGKVAARRLVELIGATGEVAVMQGFPTAPNHRQRYEAQLAALREHPGITVVDGGVDDDSIEQAQEQAASVLANRPDLSGYLCCDASGPIGIAQAIRDAGKMGQVTAVGMDGIEPILQAIKDGVLESSVATIPDLQGSMALLMLWQAAEGMRIPQRIDTGIDLITAANVDDFLAADRRRAGAHLAGPF
ncbi:MAG: substrate-binding domain-containing protein [Nocardioidaceae bacterium]